MTRQPSVMDAIARGVEARYEALFHLTEIVIGETADIASELGIPAAEIEQWAAGRKNLITRRRVKLQSSLNKLRRSPIAQMLLRVTAPN